MNATATTAAGLCRPTISRVFHVFCAVLPLTLAGSLRAASEPSLITGEKKSYAYTWEQERQLGAEADKEIVEQMGVYDNPQLQAYVQAVGDRIVGQSEFASPSAPQLYRNTKVTFRVIDSPVVNAFAVPGGYVYVTRGLLASLQNEAQLAVVLGHEIAHVAARHSSQQARRAMWGQLGAIAGAILGQKVLGEAAPDVAPAILEASGKALQLFMFRYSREHEHESDQLGVRYASHAGYAAAESAKFFNTLKDMAAAEGNALPTWQSTHPDPGDRAQRVMQLAASHSPDGRANNVGEGEYLRHIENLVVGEDPREGFAENGVYYHPVLRFQVPVAPGWKLDNQRTAVVMAEPNGRAMMGLRLAPGARARDAAMQFAQQSKMQVTASGDTTVNGLTTSVIVGKGNTQKGDIGIWNAFVELEGRVYSILGYAPAGEFERMRPTFENVAAGFAPLRLPGDFQVQPARLKLVRADRAAPFASFVPTSLPPELSAEAIAHMNQTRLDENVAQGRPLKIPEAPQRRPIASIAAPMPAGAVPQPQTPATAQPPYGASYPQSYPPPHSGQPTVPPQPSYPPQTYPPQNYPAQPAPYPSQPGSPPATTYPPQNYPQSGYPSQPQPQPYPAQPGYPQQTYPPPAGSYPQSPAPQWPQPGSTNQQSSPQTPQQQQQQQRGPVWPR